MIKSGWIFTPRIRPWILVHRSWRRGSVEGGKNTSLLKNEIIIFPAVRSNKVTKSTGQSNHRHQPKLLWDINLLIHLPGYQSSSVNLLSVFSFLLFLLYSLFYRLNASRHSSKNAYWQRKNLIYACFFATPHYRGNMNHKCTKTRQHNKDTCVCEYPFLNAL